MMSPSELMNMPGFGADRYRKIAPYVTALPTATAKINICTAPALVLESLADNLSGEYSRSSAGQRPQERLFSRYGDFQQRDRTKLGADNRESIHGHELSFSASLRESRLALPNSPCTVFCSEAPAAR